MFTARIYYLCQYIAIQLRVGKYIELLYLLSRSSPVQTLQLLWPTAMPVFTEPISLAREEEEEVLHKGIRRIPKNKGWENHKGNVSIVSATDSEGMDDRGEIWIVCQNNSNADDSLL